MLFLTFVFSIFMFQGVFNPKHAEAAVPTVRAVGSVANGTAVITPAMPAGVLKDDILLLYIETNDQAITVSGGTETWTQVTGSPVIGATATRLTVFWARASQNFPTSPTTSDSGDHQLARMIAVQGAVTSGNPIDAVSTNIDNTSSTSASITGVTTTVIDTLVVTALACSLPDANGTANFSSWTNAALASLTEGVDNTVTSGTGGALGVATGGKAIAGATGTTTVTLVAAVKAMMTLALKADITAPTAGTVTPSAGNATYVPAAFTLTTTFTDNESAVTACEYATTGSNWAAAAVSGSSPTWTCTANLSGLSGALTLNMRATSIGGTGTASAISRTVDATPPTADITYSPSGSYTAGTSVTITATFNEAMADAPVPRIAISGANTLTATNMTKSSATVYTYAYTVSAGDGVATLALSTGTDLAGNVVSSAPTSGATFTVDNTVPTVTAFTMPTTATSTVVVIDSFTANDNLAVTGYLVNESVIAPDPGDAGWSGTVPTGYTFSGSGTKTAYAWAKDAAGNVSISISATVTITTDATLNVTIDGTGSGTVNSNPSGIACPGDCSETYASMTSVTLMASPDWKSLLTWSGNCSIDGDGNCVITMDASKAVAATFNYKPQVMMPGPTYYATVQEAYNAASGSTVIKVRDQTFSENLVFNLPMDVTIDGGYDVAWVQIGSTNISGTVTIENGSVTANYLNII